MFDARVELLGMQSQVLKVNVFVHKKFSAQTSGIVNSSYGMEKGSYMQSVLS
jgi:hypothetical protein